MNHIQRAVHRARRRLNLELYVRMLSWGLFGGLLLTAIAWGVPKIWPLETLFAAAGTSAWNVSWFGAGVLIGLLAALGATIWNRSSEIDAAIEVDRRFSLKERLSSALNLSTQDSESAAGKALLADADQRAERLDVRDEFQIQIPRRAWLPLLPLAIISTLYFLPDAKPKVAVDTTPVVNETKQIEIAVKDAKQSIEEKIKQLEEKGLKDAAADLQTLAKKLDEMQSGEADLKKDALVKLNNIREELDRKKAELGDAEVLKQGFERLKEATQGTAQKLAEAIADGNFEDAKKVIQDLAKRMKEGKLTEVEKKNLAADLNKLADAAKKMIQDHEQAKADLQEQIQKAQAQGNLEKAADLQKKLDKLEAADKQIEKMKQAAENMKKCADCMGNNQANGQKSNNRAQANKNPDNQKNGGQPGEQANKQNDSGQGQPTEADLKKAQQALEDLAEQMEQMEIDQDMLEQLEDLEDDLQQCKDNMNGMPNPNDGQGRPNKPNWTDFGKGKGQGGGKRDLKEDETGEFKSRVKAELQKGETAATGDADGNNVPGATIAEAREMVKAEMTKQTDPLEDQQLPKAQREHAKQYFEKLRGGK